MFIIKNIYYLYIENSKSIDLKFLKKKFCIIYRTNHPERIDILIKFRKRCHKKNIKLYIANNYKLAKQICADGLYLSAYNKKNYYFKNIIGSAHNYSEINQKIKQKCKTIFLSRLFKTSYKNKKSFYGITKFNLLSMNYSVNLVPLGGIKISNLLKLNLVKSDGLALFSEIKKKPAITNRLF
jgi:thiamine monophosphate synthase